MKKAKQMRIAVLCFLVFVWVMAVPMTAGAEDVSAPGGTPVVQQSSDTAPAAPQTDGVPGSDGQTPLEGAEQDAAEGAEQDAAEGAAEGEGVQADSEEGSVLESGDTSAVPENAAVPDAPDYEVIIPGNIEFGNLLSYEKDKDAEIAFTVSVTGGEGSHNISITLGGSDMFCLKDAAGNFEDIPLHVYAGEREVLPGGALCENISGGIIECRVVIKADDLSACRIYEQSSEKHDFYTNIDFNITSNAAN
jgi:hypothetical protein